MSTFPIIHTPRLLLRLADPSNDTDCEIILRFYGHDSRATSPEFVRAKYDVYMKNVPDCLFTATAARPLGHYFIVYHGEEVIGMTGFSKLAALPYPEIGYLILPEHQGLGYATEAVRATLQFWHTTAGVKEILLCISTSNQGSQRVATKIGFVQSNEIFSSLQEQESIEMNPWMLPGMVWPLEKGAVVDMRR